MPNTQLLLNYADDLAFGPNVRWLPNQFTFSIPVAGSTWSGYPSDGDPYTAEYSPLNSAQAALYRGAIQAWDRLIAPSFRETNDINSPGNFRVAISGLAGGTAYAFIPDIQGSQSQHLEIFGFGMETG